MQVFHDLTYAQAFTQVRTRVLSHIHTHSRSRINTQSAFAFLSPLGTGFLFSSQLSALSTPLSSVQKAASFSGIGDYMFFFLTPSLNFFSIISSFTYFES